MNVLKVSGSSFILVLVRPDNSGHDIVIRYEQDTNTNLTRYEKITKKRLKIRHDTDKKMNTTRKYEYLKIA